MKLSFISKNAYPVFVTRDSSVFGGSEIQMCRAAEYLADKGHIVSVIVGDFGQKELTEDQLEEIGDIDVLMIPVGGEFTIDAKGATHVISQIEPKIIIPMHYAIPKLKTKLDEVDKFLKEIGKKSVVPQPKLLIKKKDLPLETQVVVLTQ